MPCLLSFVFIIAYGCSLICTYKFHLFCILQVCLGTFTVLFGASVAFGATYTTAQSAWAADAFGGVFTSSQVAADRRQQSADWVKITTTSRTTSRKQREPHALTEAQTEIEQLKRELKQVESAQKAMHEGGRAGTRGSKQSNDQEKTKGRNKDGWRDRCCACVS
jgi:hypothetical protein